MTNKWHRIMKDVINVYKPSISELQCHKQLSLLYTKNTSTNRISTFIRPEEKALQMLCDHHVTKEIMQCFNPLRKKNHKKVTDNQNKLAGCFPIFKVRLERSVTEADYYCIFNSLQRHACMSDGETSLQSAD